MKTTSVYFYYLNCGETYRVWRNDWYGDQFEVLSPEEFAMLITMLNRFSFVIKEIFDVT